MVVSCQEQSHGTDVAACRKLKAPMNEIRELISVVLCIFKVSSSALGMLMFMRAFEVL